MTDDEDSARPRRREVQTDSTKALNRLRYTPVTPVDTPTGTSYGTKFAVPTLIKTQHTGKRFSWNVNLGSQRVRPEKLPPLRHMKAKGLDTGGSIGLQPPVKGPKYGSVSTIRSRWVQ